MPRPSNVATPGDTSPKTQAQVTAAADAAARPFTPPVTAEVVRPTTDSAHGGAPVKSTSPLRGTLEEQMATAFAQIAELQNRNRDLESIVARRPAQPAESKALPTLAAAKAQVDSGETAEARRPVLSAEGWYVHPHSFETPNADLAAALKRLAG